MQVATTGLSTGDFTLLRVLEPNGDMTDVLALIGAGGSGSGLISSATSPLAISNGVLSIDLSAYLSAGAIANLLAAKISTSHEANNLALADVDHSGFGLTAESFTLKTPQGVAVSITADNGGNLSIDSQSHSNAGIVTVPYLTPLLANKANSSQVLTNVPANAVFTDTLYTHPSQHSMSMITGLTAALAGKQKSKASLVT